MKVTHYPVAVEFGDCDPAGIVFYPQYFVLFHELVEDWFNEGLLTNYAHFISVQRLGIPMGRIECDFLAPSKIGDTLRLRLSVKRIGTSSLTFAIEAWGQNELRVRATQVVVFASLENGRSVPISKELRDKIERFAV